MKLLPTALDGVAIIEPSVHADQRGWFMESFNEAAFEQAFSAAGLLAPRRFVQDNHSCSRAFVLRGLHFQRAPHAQAKLVRVVRGAAFDVTVDIRPRSPTFGHWTGVTLTASEPRQIFIDEGFAHGFLALEDETHVLYKCTDVYAPDCEGTIRWDDPALGIDWPLARGQRPQMTARDAQAPLLGDAGSLP